MVSRGWAGGECVGGGELYFGMTELFWNRIGWWLCNIVNVLNVSERLSKMAHFMLQEFHPNKLCFKEKNRVGFVAVELPPVMGQGREELKV